VTARVSVASDGSEGNGYSSEPAISSDGRYVSYHSDASNLVAGDTNNAEDVFVFDRTTGGTAQISAASDGSEGNQGSYEPELSSDGRYLTYHSAASNLVPDDTNELEDVFLWDRVTGETVRVSTASDGAQANSSSFAPAINGNGRYITYESLASNLVSGDANGMMDVFVWDRTTTETVRASVATDGSEGNGYSFDPVLSSDGRYVAYYSWSTNLVPGDTNFAADVFVWSRSGQ
jgi:Tol biopolymer transport system component